jgi:hypothetical protein
VTGVVFLTSAERAAMLAGQTYVNLGTKKNPNGEIRGRIWRA